MKKHYFIVIALLTIFVLPNVSSAQTVEELSSKIADLFKQIEQLKVQLAQTQSKPVEWCHNFNANLKVGDAGSEVRNLVTALKKEGFEIDNSEQGDLVNTTFEESTASAVSGFQQKYIDEILKPAGLKYGTGFVGKGTRAKLNKLFSCGIKPSPIAVPVSTCNVFLTCETGYTPYNAGEKDNQSCPIIKCVPAPILATPVPVPQQVFPTPFPVISEQVKCLFQGSTGKQECYSSNGNSCGGVEACVVDVKNPKSERITWKSSCGGYAYTTMDGQNEYAEFKCATAAMPTPTPTSTTTQTPIPTTPKIVTSPSPIETSVHKFKPIDSSRCTGTIAASCTLEPTNIVKVSVYDEKGGYIDTRENTNSGLAGFMNLPYGNYTVIINAEGFEYYKAPFTVCAACEETTTIFLKKISTSSTIPSIIVLDPNGGNKYLKGTTYTTRWNAVGVNTVYIKLRKGNDTYPGPEGMISDVIVNSGSYQWTVPTTLPDGDDYWFMVIDGTYGGPMDSSDAPFSIVTTASQNLPPKITGGSSLPPTIQPGQIVNFSWNAQDDNKDNLVWSVNWGDGTGMAGACPVSNPSSAQGWNLNTSHAWNQAGIYTVKIAVSDCKDGTYSQSLTVNVGTTATTSAITTPTITVISPNGGETLKLGSTYNTVWKSSNVTRVVLDLVDSAGKLLIFKNLVNVSGNPGSASWIIPTYVEPGQYWMRVGTCGSSVINCTTTGADDPVTIYDVSDAPFNVVSDVSGSKDVENLLASISQAISRLAENIKELTR